MVYDSYNPVVTKKELIDVLFKINNAKSITKDEIDRIIDIIVEEENNFGNDEIHNIGEISILNGYIHKIMMEKELSKDFLNLYFFKVNTNKYIFIKPIKDEEDIKIFDYILNQNLNEGKKDKCLREKRKDYINIFIKMREQNKSATEKFKEYDCIKIINDNFDYNNIGFDDIEHCIYFLEENENNKYLSVYDQIMLKLIILYGIKNINLNYTDYYKEQYTETLDKVMNSIENYIMFIQENANKIKDEYIGTFNLYEFLNKKAINNTIYCKDDKTGLLVNKDIIIDFDRISIYSIWSWIYINEFLLLVEYIRYISFDYYISKNKFQEAQNIFKKELKLFWYFKNNTFNVEDMISEVLLNTDNSPLKYKRNIKVILKFYIDCYYYFKYFNDKANSDKLFEFLLHFKDGYDIEDFIIKYKYTKMAEDLNEELKLPNIDDVEEVDKAINKINERITEMKLVNLFEIDDVEKTYNNIDFYNFTLENREKIKTYIATGDKIMNTFNNGKNENFDYSSAVIEWSKAVELEINEKLISMLTEEDKYNIEAYSREINSNNKYRKSHPFNLNLNDTTIGTFDAIKKYGLQDYLYNEYFSKVYTFNKETYNNLCIYLIEITTPRNNSAHKDNPINIVTATDCKDKILASTKILEILSKLEKR